MGKGSSVSLAEERKLIRYVSKKKKKKVHLRNKKIQKIMEMMGKDDTSSSDSDELSSQDSRNVIILSSSDSDCKLSFSDSSSDSILDFDYKSPKNSVVKKRISPGSRTPNVSKISTLKATPTSKKTLNNVKDSTTSSSSVVCGIVSSSVVPLNLSNYMNSIGSSKSVSKSIELPQFCRKPYVSHVEFVASLKFWCHSIGIVPVVIYSTLSTILSLKVMSITTGHCYLIVGSNTNIIVHVIVPLCWHGVFPKKNTMIQIC